MFHCTVKDSRSTAMTKILLTYALAALSSLAAQITFGPTPFNLQITGSTGTLLAPSTVSTLLEFPQFDPSLGTLTGVQFTLSNSTQNHSVSVTATGGGGS
jgi:hypothetical protein